MLTSVYNYLWFITIVSDLLLSYAVHPDPPTFLLLGTFPYFLPTFWHFRLLAYFLDFFFLIFDSFSNFYLQLSVIIKIQFHIQKLKKWS